MEMIIVVLLAKLIAASLTDLAELLFLPTPLILPALIIAVPTSIFSGEIGTILEETQLVAEFTTLMLTKLLVMDTAFTPLPLEEEFVEPGALSIAT